MKLLHCISVLLLLPLVVNAQRPTSPAQAPDRIQKNGTIQLPGTFSVNSSAQCLTGNSFIFTNSSASIGITSIGIIYTWDFGDGTTSAAANPTHTYAQSGTYKVTLSTIGSRGSNTSSQTVTVKAMPSVTAGNNVTILTGHPATLVANGAASYSWSPAQNLSCAACASTVAIPGSTTKYTVTGTASNGCTNKANITVNVAPLPGTLAGSTSTVGTVANTANNGHTANRKSTVADFTVNSSTQCLSGNSFVFTNASTGAGLSYVWTFGDGGSSTSTSPTRVYTATGTYTVTLIANGTGGSDTTSQVMTVISSPTVTATGSAVICKGASTTLGASGGVTYSWSPAASLSCTTCSSPVASPTTTTTYTVTGTGENGCTKTATVIVTVNPQPATPTGTAQMCNGSTYTFTDATSGGTWSSSDPSVATIGSSSGAVNCINTGANVITYTLSSTGCYNTLAVTVNPVAEAISGVAPVCIGNTITLTDVTAGGTWATSSTSIATVGSSTGVVTGVAAGTATMSYTTNPGGCKVWSVVTVSPAVSAVSGSSSVCVGSTITLTDATSGGTWSSSNANATVGSSSGIVTGVASGTVTISYIVSTGCNKTKVVTVNPLPTIGGTGAAYCSGNTGTLGASGGSTYTWSPATGLSCTACTAPVCSSTISTTYTVTGTSTLGCSNTAAVAVTVNPLPAAISGAGFICLGRPETLSSTTAGGTWTSQNTSRATVGSATGIVSGVATGTVNISYILSTGCYVLKNVTVSPAVSLSATTTNVSCFGGTNGAINLSVSGGTSAFTYAWSNGATAQDISTLSAATYDVLVTDARGCTATLSKTITEPAALTATATTTNVACYGNSTGAIDLTVTGGTTAYSYSWSNGASTQDLTGKAAGTYSVTVTDSKGCTATLSKTITQPSAALAASATTVNVLCRGASTGAVDLTVTGGTTPYAYSWSNSATTQDLTGIAAGTYSVTVTDANGCTTTVSKTITQPATAISASATATNILCYGNSTGAIDLSVTGGTGSYTYSWSNGATTQDLTGRPAGTYSVVATDANGCTATVSKTITQPAEFIASATTTNVACYGNATGAIDLSVTGGTGSYTYSWSNGATTQDLTGKVAGNYSVVVTDGNSCTTTLSKTITQPSAALSASAATTNVLCYGNSTGAIDLTVTGGTTAYTYNWSNGSTTQDLTALAAGTYSVLVTDANGCTTTVSKTITQPAVAFSISATTTNVSCFGETSGSIDLSVTGGTASYTYNWSNGATTQDLGDLGAGTYNVLVTDAVGCTATGSYSVTGSAAITIDESIGNASCYGASNGAISVSVTGSYAPFTYSWSNGATSADISDLAAGSYSLTVTDSLGCSVNTSYTVSSPDELIISQSATNIICYGGTNGSIDIDVTGGIAPYSYSWSSDATSEDISDLAAGDYSVTVTDANGCMQSATITITQPEALVLSATTHSVLCGSDHGLGEIDLEVNGGTSDYTYAWSNGASTANDTGLWTGTYTVVVTDAAGCTATDAYSVTSPAALTIATTVSDVSCYGGSDGSISAVPADGTPAYTISWSTGDTTPDVSGLPAGVYTVDVTDANGCTVSSSLTVAQPDSLVIPEIAGLDAVCVGATITLTDSLEGGVWSGTNTRAAVDSFGVVTGLTKGTALITYAITNSCGTFSAYKVVSVNDVPAVSSISGVINMCTGSLLTLTGSPAGGTWNSSDSTLAPINSAGVVSAVEAGSLSISYTLTNQCGDKVGVKTLTVLSGAGTIEGNASICPATTTTLTNATPGGVSWTSGNLSVATVNSSTGVVSGLVAGTARITYTIANGCRAIRVLTVNSLPAVIGGTLKVCTDKTTTLTNTTTGGTWSVADETVATIGTSGIVTGNTTGTTPVTYTSVLGCIKTAIVTVNPSPLPVTYSSATCAGITTSMSDATSGGTWASVPTSVATIGSATGVLYGSTAGTATVSYTIPGTGCRSTSVITINAAPAAITGTLKVCDGSLTTLTNTTAGGTWSIGDSTIAGIDETSGIVSGIEIGTARVTYTSTLGCYKTAIVTVNPTPAPIGTPGLACVGMTTAFTDSTPGGAWASSTTSVATIVSSTGILTGVSGGTATISYSIAATGCRSTQVVTVNPTAATISGVLKVCEGAYTTLSNTVSDGAWSVTDPSVATIDDYGVVSGVLAGTTRVTYTLPTGCFKTAIVTVNPLPASISSAAVTCVGVSTTMSDATTGGTWTSGTTSVATIVSSTGVASALSAGTALISYTLPTGCRATKALTVNPLPSAITGTLKVCIGGTTVLADATTDGTWSVADEATATVDGTGIVSGITVGTTRITYTLATGCFKTAIVTVNPLPAAIATTGTVCSGSTTTMSDATTGGTWTSSTTSVATVVSTSGVLTGVSIGTATVTYNMSTGCRATTIITVNAAATTNTGRTSICAGGTTTLANITAGGVWSSAFDSVATINESTGVLTGVSLGTTKITYTIAAGCRAVSTFTVTGLPAAITGTTSVCIGGVSTLASATAGGVWQSGNLSIATVGSANRVVAGVAAGTAIISYYVGSSACAQTTTVTVNGAPVPAPISGDAIVAVGDVTTLSDDVAGGTWTSSAVSIATISASGVATGVSAGTTTISYRITTTCGTGTVTKVVTVNPAAAGRPSAPLTGELADASVIDAYPNPFYNYTTIRFTLTESAQVTVEVFDAATGKKVANLFNDVAEGGKEQTVILNGTDLVPGVYIYRVATGNKSWNGKLMLTR